jgi:transcriptional regulator with XRE-family HTH domain
LKKTIGRTLKHIRIEKGMSQGDIERKTGLLRSYLSRVENGHTVPSLDTLGRIAEAVGVSAGKLLEEPEGEAAKTAVTFTDKRQLRFWKLMRRYAPRLDDRQRSLLVGLSRRMAGDR